METARYKAFVAAAESGSFTLAAEGLGYTPSGVSQLVNALEGEVGFPLLRRSNRGVRLTREGEDLLPVIRALLQQEDNLFQRAAEVRGVSTGHITIATYSSVASHWLPLVISAFEQDYPNVSIQLIEGTRAQLVDLMNDAVADLGFISDLEDTDFSWWPLEDVPIVVLVPPGHPLARRERVTLEECVNEPFIFSDSARSGAGMKLLREAGLQPNIKFSTQEDYSAMNMIAYGLGIGISNLLIMKNMVLDLVQLPLDPPRYITMTLAVRDWEQASPATRKFCSYARKMLTSDKYSSRK